MGDTTWFLSMKAQFIPLGITFGSCEKHVGHFQFYSFRKRWDILEEDQEAGGCDFRDWNNSEMPWVNGVVNISFCS